MAFNQGDYWKNQEENAVLAQEHIRMCEEEYGDEIVRSAKFIKLYDDNIFENAGEWKDLKAYFQKPEIILTDMDSVSALFKYGGKRTLLLDFASYTECCGNFLSGSMAQEESLCHHSTLYNVLQYHPEYYEKNRQHISHGLYQNRCIICPEILFLKDGNTQFADVVVCAAPNMDAFRKYTQIHPDEKLDAQERNMEVLRNRFAFLRRSIEFYSNGSIDTLILGAWGCGQNGQSPLDVAMMFEANFFKSSIGRIVYAIPDKDSPNWNAFAAFFGKENL